jgi:hypothetical protein
LTVYAGLRSFANMKKTWKNFAMGRLWSLSALVSQPLCCFSAAKVSQILVLWLPLYRRRDFKSVSFERKINIILFC